ncbi:DUF3180 domain-containing protein [Corynebacterium sp. CCM 8835]|uniref:DUF3180 domain-containing protein n=1 Tax=Corynebacterium antarcticum TaxID=2800405 RepID=A0ABS1FJ21_9CORY|nr:DUF3180 domain-containing protein [Corynebacterium antarcticum]MCK7643363.1 DUF3180 domain-containing protein [Corynebacterium antarcticum]MCL0246475.1 DUF3180 domain-containing protein [Corynebacterium antarcticum]MCX7492616.1 DUF3180 domain-containing protein [Corynebacterium antarcticum]MCX7541209.1 DUF3180 domain-containing protein [Corynebacterium antarcticum]
MRATQIPLLVATALFCAGAAAILTWRFYVNFIPISVTASATLWLMAGLCGVLAWRVRVHLDKGRIGLDRSQLNPITVAQWLVIGKASAWTGSVVGGAYLGMSVYVVPRSGTLVAASDDLPGVLVSFLGGLAMAVAGVILERSCEVPPPSDGEPAAVA